MVQKQLNNIFVSIFARTHKSSVAILLVSWQIRETRGINEWPNKLKNEPIATSTDGAHATSTTASSSATITSFASFAFPEKSEVKKWLVWQKHNKRAGKYKNLAFWAIEDGLKQALMETYGAASNVGLLEKSMSASMHQQPGTTTTSTNQDRFLRIYLYKVKR